MDRDREASERQVKIASKHIDNQNSIVCFKTKRDDNFSHKIVIKEFIEIVDCV